MGGQGCGRAGQRGDGDPGNPGVGSMNSVMEKEMAAGEAGHSGAEIRSDVQVRVEPRDRGGVDIAIESRVQPYYGNSIRRQAGEVLEALGVRDRKSVV